MKFFLFISLLTAILLGITNQLGLQKTLPSPKKTPLFMVHYKQKIKSHFERPENANILFSFFTGDKNGISPYTKLAFKRVNLIYLFSPSGIHLSGIFLFLSFFLKKIKTKWIRHALKACSLSSFFLLPNFESIKRLVILRLLFQFKFLSKIKISTEKVFIITFLFSFLIGQYYASPLGYIFSFAFLGTFFSLRNSPKVMLILGLYSTQLIIGLFMGNKVSLVAVACGLFGSFIFTLLFPFFLIFLMSFWIIQINWIEPFIRFYVVGVQMVSKCLSGSFTSSSVFLILAIWVIMFSSFSMKKGFILLILIFLHTNTAMAPALFST